MQSLFGGWRHHLPAPLGSVSLDSQSPTVPCESSSLATTSWWDYGCLAMEHVSAGKHRAIYSVPRMGWQGNTIRKGAKRPENRVTRFPVEKSGAAGKGEASAASQSAERLSCHMTQKANSVTLTLYSSPVRAIPQPSARRAVKLKNLKNPRGAAPSTFTPQVCPMNPHAAGV